MCVEEYLDLVRHTDENDRLIQKYNADLISEYTFIKPETDDYDYSYTEMDSMPEGWRIAFGDKFLKDIKEELVRCNCLDTYKILEIKEKYGALRCYGIGDVIYSSIPDILHRYEKLSARTCIHCGKPATKISTGWISPWCDECAKEFNGDCVDIDKWYSKDE